MNRENFFAKLLTFDEERLKKALWNLYWRGSVTIRERIEAEVDPAERDRRQRLCPMRWRGYGAGCATITGSVPSVNVPRRS